MIQFLKHIKEGFSIAVRALRANPGRSILTTLGIVIGVLTVILMITIVQGLNKSFKSQLEFIGSGTLFVNRTPWIIMGDYFKYRNRPEITVAEYKRVKDLSQLASVVSVSMETGKSIKYKENRLSRISISGVDAEYINTMTARPEYGRFLNDIDVGHNKMVAVLGSAVAEKLFDRENPIGRRINIGGRKFRVIGVLEEQGKFLDFSLDEVAFIPYGALMKNYGKHHWASIVAKAADPSKSEDLEYELTGIMRRIRGLHPSEEDNFAINKQSMLLNLYKQVTSGVYAVGIGIGGIALLVGGIGIMNIMLASVTERTREIGIRKAIGAKKSNIIWQFLIESAAICSIGGVIGLGLAWIAGVAVNNFLPTSMNLLTVIFAISFSAVIGIFFGLWPAIKASRLHPIESLRYE